MSDWAEKARALKNEIEAARAFMDAERRCPDALAEMFAAAGFFRLCVPKIYGGAQAPPHAVAATLEALAEIDASAAWCAMIGATTSAVAAYLEPDAAREIFGAPGAIVTGVYAPMGKASAEGDHYRVNGQWKWNSAGQNSRWLLGGCMIVEDGKPKLNVDGSPMQRMILAPREAVTFVDTWRTSGLRGTGSGDMTMRDVLVPKARSVSLVDDRPRVKAPLYAFPVFGLLAMGIAAVASGNAKAARWRNSRRLRRASACPTDEPWPSAARRKPCSRRRKPTTPAPAPSSWRRSTPPGARRKARRQSR